MAIDFLKIKRPRTKSRVSTGKFERQNEEEPHFCIILGLCTILPNIQTDWWCFLLFVIFQHAHFDSIV